MKKEVKIPDQVVFFDGVCNLCNAAVRFIIRFDKDRKIHFASLDSDIAREILGDDYTKNTLVYYDRGKVYFRSTGALRIAKTLKYFSYFYYFIFIPKNIRDPLYDLIAKYRYRMFGKKDSCPLPDESIVHLFIDQTDLNESKNAILPD